MAPRTTDNRLSAVVAAALLVVIAIVYWVSHFGTAPKPGQSGTPAAVASSPAAKIRDSVDLSDSQLEAVKVEPVDEHDFPVEKEAVGSIDFNEDLAVQVFTPYQGRIISLFAEVGDDVKKGQTLFTIDSPDLLQAESTLIAAAGVLDLNRKNLDRLQGLYTTRAVSQHDVEQAASDEQTAEGNLRAARDAVRLFGKSDADIDRIIADRSADPTLVVPSPIAGRITARNAAPGLFVQPGNRARALSPSPISTRCGCWPTSPKTTVRHSASASRCRSTVDAFPGRVFEGKVTTIGASVDPNTRRVLVRSEVKDPRHELRSGMFANFVIDVGTPQRSPASRSTGWCARATAP